MPAVDYENKPSNFLFNTDVSRQSYFGERGRSKKSYVNKGKKHIFHDGYQFGTFNVTTLCAAETDVVNDKYADLVDTYMKMLERRSKVN